MLGSDTCCPGARSPLPFETSKARLERIPNTPPTPPLQSKHSCTSTWFLGRGHGSEGARGSAREAQRGCGTQGCSELTRLRRCRAAGKLYASQETLEVRQDYNPETQGDGSFGRRSQSRASAARRCPLSPPRHMLIWFILVGWLVPTTTNRTCHAAIIARLVAQLIINKKGLKGIKYLNRTHAANGNL